MSSSRFVPQLGRPARLRRGPRHPPRPSLHRWAVARCVQDNLEAPSQAELDKMDDEFNALKQELATLKAESKELAGGTRPGLAVRVRRRCR